MANRPATDATLPVLDACATPLDQAESVLSAAARMADAAATAEAAAKRLARYERALDVNRRGHDTPNISDQDLFEAVEFVAAARIDQAKTYRQAAEARSSYEASVDAERVRRRALVRQAKAATRARLLDSGARFLADLEEAHQLDRAEFETLTLQLREADAMSGGGVFGRLAVIEVECLKARLAALRAITD
jgi:hypothetical protein